MSPARKRVMSISYVLLFLHSTLLVPSDSMIKDIYHLQSVFTDLLSIQSTSLTLLIFYACQVSDKG